MTGPAVFGQVILIGNASIVALVEVDGVQEAAGRTIVRSAAIDQQVAGSISLIASGEDDFRDIARLRIKLDKLRLHCQIEGAAAEIPIRFKW